MPRTQDNADFCLTIDFEKSSGNPARIFRAATELIDALNYLDKELVGVVDSRIEPVLLLEDIESGSLKIWLAQAIKHVPDETLLNLDWEPLIGQFLVKAKYIAIDFLAEETEVTDLARYTELAQQLQKTAEETEIKRLPHYQPPPLKGLLTGASKITGALSHLHENDKVRYTTKDAEASFNMRLNLAPENIEDLLTTKQITHDQTMILKIKKPDYIGKSQWEFKHGKETILAKITDEEWLESFQNRQVDVRPQDSLEVTVQVIVKYGLDDEVVGHSFIITKVLDVRRAPTYTQTKIDTTRLNVEA
ncbi:MAG: hypothetical protein KC474_12195 [Cyanobacteria bacterium HKST-UBA04]|nr:hypothetical protein [Candidatus Saccharibacteria bacterium]MCA9800301.1 hypothetical protein [Cyanobacteria bacterium HKST-UBA04]